MISAGIAILTWNLIFGVLFIGLPSCAVEEICINGTVCLVPENTVVVVLPWETPVERIEARCALATEIARPLPVFTG